MYEYNSIAESNNFIVLDKYEKYASCVRETGTYQTEADLEHEFIQDLRNQGYEYLPDLTTPEAMFENARVQLQILNDVKFTDSEWTRFCEEYLDKASDNHIDKTRKIHDDYIYDLGECMFCELCVNACPHEAIKFVNDFENSTFGRDKLVLHLDKEKFEPALPNIEDGGTPLEIGVFNTKIK